MTDPRNELQPWPLNGYAPGGYHCKCHECGKLFEGDKRAVTCLVCAVILSKRAAIARTADGPEPVAVTKADILREWFGGDRYARDHEYIDASFGNQADRIVAFITSALTHPVPDGPADAVSEAEVDAALGAWRAAPGLGVNKAIIRICLEAAQRARP